MSILIKGMEMPKNCLGCPLTWVDDDYNSVCPFTNVVALNIGKQDNCPLIGLPEKHGRLIDADELIDGCEKLMRMLDPEDKEYIRVFAIKSYLMWAAEYAVIEAEGSET